MTTTAPQPIFGNLGEPIRLTGVHWDGVAAEPASSGDAIKVWVKLAITSDNPAFYPIADGFARAVTALCHAAKQSTDVNKCNMVLLVLRPDKSAELWMDTAAVALNMLTKRDIVRGALVFEHDVVDVNAMSFPLVTIGHEDRVVCLFREGWRFALAFDFNPDKSLAIDDFQRTLGSLYRSLRYRHIYDAIENAGTFEALIKSGWFPFAEIITSEFRELSQACEAGFELSKIEQKIIAAFDNERLERMLKRWLARPHFAAREPILRSAVKNFVGNDPVAVIKIVLTEIEGVLNAAHRAAHGTGAKRKTLVEFAVRSAERKAGGPYTMLLPNAFAHYLDARTFARFDPIAGGGDAGSRHAVGHGEALAETYTQVTALQALLTLDHLAFST